MPAGLPCSLASPSLGPSSSNSAIPVSATTSPPIRQRYGAACAMSSGCAPSGTTRASASVKNSSASTFNECVTVPGKDFARRSCNKVTSIVIFFGVRPGMLFCRSGCLSGYSSSMEYELAVERIPSRHARPPEIVVTSVACSRLPRRGASGHGHPEETPHPSLSHSHAQQCRPSPRAVPVALLFSDTIPTAPIRAPASAQCCRRSRPWPPTRSGVTRLFVVRQGGGISPPYSGLRHTVAECHAK